MTSPTKTIQAEALALHILRQLAKKYVAVQLTIADCGCHTIELFADGEKVCEEDKDLSVATAAIVERLKNMNYASGNIGDVHPLSWTTEPPTVEGWYWVKDVEEQMRAERVFIDCHVLCIYFVNSAIPIPLKRASHITHWLGPLPVPEPPKE